MKLFLLLFLLFIFVSCVDNKKFKSKEIKKKTIEIPMKIIVETGVGIKK